jgi:predicted nucleic acid-binding Zn ribbon protein
MPKKYELRRLLNDWYGRELGENEMLNYLPSPQALSDTLDKVMARVVSDSDIRLFKLRDNWQELVGTQIAQVSVPHSFKDHCLYVEVSRSIWLRELKGTTKSMILKKVQDSIGAEFCRDIKFILKGRE